ncbi:MAG TPA: hypothetical protein EYP86_01210 [Candidatus Altiarchaeales archaeon]|nr:hypothetical protein [Candidatus Altiarchaeales archaeon]
MNNMEIIQLFLNQNWDIQIVLSKWLVLLIAGALVIWLLIVILKNRGIGAKSYEINEAIIFKSKKKNLSSTVLYKSIEEDSYERKNTTPDF